MFKHVHHNSVGMEITWIFSVYILKKDVQAVTMLMIQLFSPKSSFKLFSRISSNHVLPQTSNDLEPLFMFAPFYILRMAFSRLSPCLGLGLQMLGALRGDAADPAPLQPSPGSSHDPSAAPTIPRARTRWKKAATAGEQCFGNKTPSGRTRRDSRHLSNHLRSCGGEWAK